jgi:endoglucanase
MIAVEVRDAPFMPGRIEPLPTRSREEPGTWIRIGTEWGRVVGRDRPHVRISDIPPSAYLDRERLDAPENYPTVSNNKVTSVYRKSVPYDSGIYRGSDGETMTGASLKHYIYLSLAQPITEGHYTIRWPASILPDIDFDYSSLHTRAIAIRANQHGYRAADTGKVAYLSLWIPGGPLEGAVDFRQYGIKSFEIIDESGKLHFSSDLKLRVAPTDPEPGNGFPQTLLEYPSASSQATQLTRVDTDPALALRAPRHTFSVGQRIWLDGFPASQKRFNGFATIRAVTRDTFEIDEHPGGATQNTASSPTAYSVHKANRAGTYVFELNFGSWKPAYDGKYRLRVPGLGVSDTFAIRDDIWLQAGRASIGGLYNHRSGIALDGRFGFTRPEAFRPGSNTTVYLSKLPLHWTSNSELGFVPADDGGKSPWVTNSVAPSSYWGGYMDAGDWDRRIDHIDVSILMLDVFESSPDSMNEVVLGLPKSSELLDRELYADLDDLPDILHEAVWTLDFFRRLQLPDGSIRGGIESSAHPLLGVPSFLEHLTVFAYSPDHISTYRYISGAAKLAVVLQGRGKVRAAQVFRQSSLNAWQAAERINHDPERYYADAKSIATATGTFRENSWESRSKKIQNAASEYRVAAAGALFRLTGGDEYRTIFETAWPVQKSLYRHNADGAWEYYKAQSPTANKTLQEQIGKSFQSEAQSTAKAQTVVSYPGMKHPFAPIGWGQGLAPDFNQTQTFIRAHQISQDTNLLQTMQVASAQILGANQVGLSFTTGLGTRNIQHPLHEDHRAMGVKAPDGITIYGWAPQSQTSHDWIFGPYWSPLPVSGTKESAERRKISPNRFAMPFYEYLIEHPLLVMQQEYTVQQTIATTAAMWLYLHVHGRERS